MIRKTLAVLAAIAIAGHVLLGLPASAIAAARTGAMTPTAIVALAPAAPLTSGSYPVQQATYDDTTGDYALMVLNTLPGVPPVYRTEKLQLARLTDDQIKAGQKPYLGFNNGEPVFYLDENFKIDYVHSETAVQTNPQTGQKETVIVRQERTGWSPFTEVLTDAVLLNMLYRPRYYVPPVYAPGRVMTGYGGAGSSYDGAIDNYRNRNNDSPAAVKNRQQFRSTGNLSRPAAASPASGNRFGSQRPGPANTAKTPATSGTRATGSGFGGSNLRTGATRSRPNPARATNPSRQPLGNRNSFGSNRPRSSFGSGLGGNRARSSFGSGFGGGRPRASFGGRRR